MKKLCLCFALLLALALLALPAAADENVVFLATGGTGDGSSASAPVGSMTAAYAALGGGGGKIVVCGAYTLGNTSTTTLPAHTGTVTVTSRHDGVDYAVTNAAKLVFNGSSFVKLSGATVFDAVTMTLNQTAAGICANFHPLTITDSVSVVRSNGAAAYAMYLVIGTNGDTVNTLPAGQTLEVTVNGGKFINLTAFTRQIATTNLGTVILNIGGNADVRDLSGGALSTGGVGGSSVINLSDSAHVSTLYLGGYNSGGMKGNVTLNVSGSPDVTTIANHGAAFFPTGEKHLYTSGSTFMLPGGYMDIFDYVTADGVRIKPASQNPAIYVANGGEGDGTAAESPMGDFANAYAALSVDGGDLILVGDTTVSSAATLPDKGGDVRILSQNGARLSLNANLNFATNTLGAGVTFDLPIVSSGAAIFGGFHSVTFGEHTTVSGALDFFGGVDTTDLESDGTAVAGLPYTLTVAGGTFRNFYGGNFRSDYIDPVGSIAAPLTVHITGGSFTGEVGLSGMSILADDASLVIEGGVFSGDLFVQSGKGPVGAPASRTSALTKSNRAYYAQDGDITVTISGGSFAGGIYAAKNEVSYTQLLRGNYTVNVTGGSFASGAVLDATQVKAYADGDEVAALTYTDGYDFTVKRFDLVNGVSQTYDEPLRVAFVGDSITEGPRPNIHLNSYPAVFASIAAQENGDVIVANYGIASAGLLSTTSTVYFDRLAYPLVMEETDADLIFIAIGTNDNAAGLDNSLQAQYRERLYTLASDLGALPDTKKVYISNALTRQNENVAQIRVAGTVRPLQEQVAAELIAENSTKFGFVDLYALTLPEAAAGGFFSSDNLHPSVAGYAKMGQIVYDALFDGLTPAAYKRTDVYLSANGSRYGAGTESDPTSAIDVALSYLPSDTPATLHIVGNITYPANIQTKLGGGKLTIVGEGADASLTINGGTQFKLYSDTEIENLTLTTTDAAYILGCYHDLTLANDVTLSGDWSFAGGYPAYSRDTAATVSAANDFAVSIDGVGRLKNFTLGNLRVEATAPFGTYGGSAVGTVGENTAVGGAGATLLGAVGQNYLSGSVNLTVENGAGLLEYALPGTVTSPAVYDAANNTGEVTLTAPEVEEPVYGNVIFVCDGGTGDGSRASTPAGSLAAAYAALPNGGTIVICGSYTVGNTSAVTLPAAGGTVTLTSVFADVDYRATNSAKLVFNGTSFLKLSSATVFDAITMSMDQSAAGICANFHPVTFTESVSIVRTSGTAGYFMYF
ncbi:MAG: SGNH/GDSL hydrolase family protein, partial [Clostridia bacterium]|nr:SGNH/GDSL hydrolase family protein [Clostridia bacterium]